LELGRLTSSESVTLPGGTLWALISEDSSGNLPGGLFADSSFFSSHDTQTILNDFGGATIAQGSQIAGGFVVATGSTLSSPAGDIGSSIDFTISDFSGLAVGDKLAVYWFPGQTESNITLPTNNFEIGGFQRTTVNTGSGGNSALIVPSDSEFSVTMAYFDNAITSGNSGIEQTSFQAIAVPEPSTLALLGMSFLILATRRQR